MKILTLILLMLFTSLTVFANTDDCKTDVYFANGIKTEQRTAIENADILEVAIIDMLGTEAFTKQIGKVSYSYNETHGLLSDGIETFYQKFGWVGLSDLLGASHGRNLSTQIKAYETSINAEHKVLVVAHSQGNLFTYEAYTALSSDMQKSFEAVSIASPMSADIKYGTSRIDWDNDPVPRISTLGAELPNMLSNDVRVVNWESSNVLGTGKPISDYTTVSNIGATYTDGGYPYVAEEAGVDLASKVHAFTFYMGQPLGEGDDKIIYDPFTNTTLVDGSARAKIMTAISTKLDILGVCEDKDKDKCHDIKNSIQPEDGIIGISLRWSNPEINMSLSSAIGSKDISASEGSPFEHYYVKSEDDVSPGIYPVSVSSSGDVNESSLPQSINLSIHAPGSAMTFDFEITAVNQLNLGHVADIKITEKGEVEVAYKGGGSGGNDGSGGVTIKEYIGAGYVQYVYEIKSKLKQATLGVLSDAGITLTDAINFENSVEFYESSTSGGNSILTSGIFYFSSEALSSLTTDNFYVLSVNGGNDIDADDDGVLDAVPTLNLGSIHAVVDEKTLKNENFKVNILTEVAFQLTKEFMHEDLNVTLLQEKLDDIATRLLKEDVNGDEVIDYKDILAWQPIHDKDKLRLSYEEYYQPLQDKIHTDESLEDEFTLEVDSLNLTIKEEISAGTEIGIFKVISRSEIASMILSGEGSEKFNIDLNGSVSISQGVIVSYLEQRTFSLSVEIMNENGQIRSTSLVIHVTPEDLMSVLGKFSSQSIYDITLSKDGNTMYLADTEGLKILDVSNPSSVVLISYYSSATYFSITLSHDENIGYATGLNILHIIDISNESAPFLIKEYSMSAGRITLSKNKDILYMDSNSTISIFDISSPSELILLSSYETYNFFGDISLSNDENTLYYTDSITEGESFLTILDISNNLAPSLMSRIQFESAGHIEVSEDGKTILLSDSIVGFTIVDIENPYTPRVVEINEELQWIGSFTLSSDESIAYVEDYFGYVNVVDISNLKSNKTLHRQFVEDNIRAVILSPNGNKLYVLSKKGLLILDVSYFN